MATVQKKSGKLYYTLPSLYATNKGSLIAYDDTNPTTWKASYDAIFARTQFANLAGFSYTLSKENEETFYGMGCTDEGDSIILVDAQDTVTKLTASVASIDYALIAGLLNADYTVTLSGTTPVVNEAKGIGWTVGEPIKLNFKSYDSSEVTAVTVKEDNVALIAVTDYDIFVGSDGFSYIYPKTAQTGVITANYTYKVPAGEDMHVENTTVNVPRTAYKFVSCAYQTGDPTKPRARDVLYFTEGKLGGDLTEKYYKKGENFEGVEMEISCDAGQSHLSRVYGMTKAAVNVTP